jgi:hypothetical protein
MGAKAPHAANGDGRLAASRRGLVHDLDELQVLDTLMLLEPFGYASA